MLRKIYLIAALVLTSSFAMAQSGTLKGVITDAMSGEAIPFANIVAERNGNQSARHTFPRVVNTVSIRSGKAAGRFMLEGNLFLFGNLDQAVNDQGMTRSSMRYGRAAPHRYLAVLLRRQARGIRGVSDISAYADIRLKSMGRHFGAVTADFLLNRIKTN